MVYLLIFLGNNPVYLQSEEVSRINDGVTVNKFGFCKICLKWAVYCSIAMIGIHSKIWCFEKSQDFETKLNQ